MAQVEDEQIDADGWSEMMYDNEWSHVLSKCGILVPTCFSLKKKKVLCGGSCAAYPPVYFDECDFPVLGVLTCIMS